MRKKILLILGCLVLAVIVVGGAGIAWLFLRKPAMAPPSSIKVAMTPERIARGQYIYETLADCASCHSQRDFTRFGGPEVPTGRGRGNILSDILKGLPGVVVAPNPFSANRCSSSTIFETPTWQPLELGPKNPAKRL